MKGLAVAAVLLGVVWAGAAAATAPRPPANLRAGDPWTAVVQPRQAAGARLEIRLGTRRHTFAMKRGKSTSVARVIFPAAGRWTYGVRSGTRFRRLGAATIRPRRLRLLEPFDVVHASGGLVITDRLAGAVYLLRPDTGAWRRVAAVPEARELAAVDDRTVLVSSSARILRLDLASGATSEVTRVDEYVLGLDRGQDGSLYVSDAGATILRVSPAGERAVLASGRNGVHGILVDGDRLVAMESFAGNVLSIDLASRELAVLASGLGNPSFAVPGPGGGLYVSEFAAGRITLLAADGVIRHVASVPGVGPLATSPDGTLVAASISGDLVRIDPATGAVRSLLR